MADYSIVGDTRLDASGFNKGLSAMSVAAGNLISGLVKTGTEKIAGLTKASVGVGMSFQSSMSQVAATMGTSVDQIQNLTDKAKEMGSTTAFTATQAADALNYLALAGYDANKAAEVLPSVLNLAAAGGMDLAYASDLVTDAMASLNIEANKQNVDAFGNKLAMAASKANANVSQLGEAILTVGGTAANLREGTTELTTALGILANVGIKGAEGGTHLRNIILSLQSPTKDASEVMSELGLEVYDAQGNMRGLDDILTDLNDTMDGMTQGEKDGIINALFNKTDLAAVNGLLAAQGETWETLADQIDAAGEAAGDSGAMAQMAETQLDNLQGSITIMQSALEGLQLGIYEYLEPSLNDAAKWGAECFSTLTSALTEDGPEGLLQAAGQIISDLSASISAQLPGLTEAAVEIIAQLSQDLTAAMPSIMDTGAQVLSALITGITESLPQLLASATEIICSLVDYIGQHADEIIDAGVQCCEALVIGITENLPQLITSAAMLVANLAAALISHLPDILVCGAALLTTLVDGILRSIENLGEAALACIGKLLGVWDGTMDEWGHIGENIVQGLLNGITGMWDSLVSSVKGKVSGMVDTVKGVLGIHSPSKVFDDIGVQTCAGLAQGMHKGTQKVKDAAKTVVASVTSSATQLVDGVTTTTEIVTERMASGATQQKKTVTETSRQMVNGVLSDVKTITTTAADGSQKVTQSIEAVRDVISTVKSTQTSLVDGVETTVEKTAETLADGTEQIKTVTTQTGKEVIDGVEHTVKTVTTTAADGTQTVEKIIDDARNVVSTVKDIQTSLVDGVETTVERTTETLADETEQQKQVITSTGTEIIDGVKRTVKTVTTIAADGTKTVTKTIEDAGPQYASAAELLTTQFRQKLDDGWKQIESDIQTDALGAIETLAKAIQNGDLEQLGLWAAEYFWNACTNEQKQQIQALALGALNQLSSALSGVGTNLAALASSLVAKFVPAATTATGAQTALNVAMDANPILLVISLLGMLVGALVNFASTNKSVASSIKNVWNGLADFMSIIFEGALRVAGLAIEGFILTINSLISAYNAIPGVKKIDKVKNPLWNGADKLAAERKQRQEERSAQSKLDAQYEADTSAIEKKQMEAQYAKKKAELEKAKLSSDDPGMLDAEKSIAKADYEKDLADLEKKLIDAEYEKASAELAKKSTKDKAKLAELEKQILAADNTIQTGELEKELLKLDYEKTLKELESKYSKPSGSTDKSPEPDTDPSLPDNTDAIKDNTDALLAANEKLAEMVRQADSLVLSDNMAVTRTVAASGTAQVAAAANSYHREGDTNITQNIYSKAQTAADLQREARWEADRAKAQKH